MEVDHIIVSTFYFTPHIMQFVAAKNIFWDCFGRYIISTVPMDSDAEEVTGMIQCILL